MPQVVKPEALAWHDSDPSLNRRRAQIVGDEGGGVERNLAFFFMDGKTKFSGCEYDELACHLRR